MRQVCLMLCVLMACASPVQADTGPAAPNVIERIEMYATVYGGAVVKITAKEPVGLDEVLPPEVRPVKIDNLIYPGAHIYPAVDLFMLATLDESIDTGLAVNTPRPIANLYVDTLEPEPGRAVTGITITCDAGSVHVWDIFIAGHDLYLTITPASHVFAP